MKKPIRRLAPQGKHFYSHLIEFESLQIELNEMRLSAEEREHLLSLAQSNLHHTVLDAILSELSEDDKKMFLTHVASEDHGKTWEFLFKKIDNIEEKIKKAADLLKQELHKDIKEAKTS